ncbi:MAG: 50S ribosomal protein L24 [bacterium]|nr:50S ribosomal protein L24 [bacterium]
MAIKIRKNDTVQILAGKDKGKKGKVIQVLPEERKVVVEGVNSIVKHLRPRRAREKGQKVHFNAPLHISNVILVSPKSGKTTRVGYTVLEDGKKVRVARKDKEVID